MMIPTRWFSKFYSLAGKSKKVSPVRCGLLCLLLPGLMIACDKMESFSRPHVATVNGAKIYLDEYQSLLNEKARMLSGDFFRQPAYVKKFEDEVLDAMIGEKIMLLRARELNLSVSDAELEAKIKELEKDYGNEFTGLFARQNINYEKWKEDFRKEILLQKLIAADVHSKIIVSETEIEDYFKKHRHIYKRDLSARVSQIVVRDMQTAEQAMQRLKSKEEFARVASEMSIGPEASRGGDLGFITKRVMPEPLDETIFKIPVQTISPIVQSSYGFHIIKVMEVRQAKERILPEAREEVIADIRLLKEKTAFAEWLEALKKKAVVQKKADIKINTSYR